MITYTPAEINTILYRIEYIDGLLVLVEYLRDNGQFYRRYIPEWLEDIRLMMVIFN